MSQGISNNDLVVIDLILTQFSGSVAKKVNCVIDLINQMNSTR